MKALNRRGFVRALGAIPFAGKMAVDAAVANVAGIASPALGSLVGRGDVPPCSDTTAGNEVELVKRALRVPALRGEIESLLYEEQRRVHFLDPDLAAKRSFSMAAKITFQRQRNVERELQESWLHNSTWRNKRSFINNLAQRLLGL